MDKCRLFLLVLVCAAAIAVCAPVRAQDEPPEAEAEVNVEEQPFGDLQPYDPEEAQKRRQEMVALGKAFQELMRDHPEVETKHPDDFARALLKVEKCALLFRRYMPSTMRDATFKKELEDASRLIHTLADGKRPEAPRTGLIELAYLSDIDRSAQPYVLYVPETTDLKKPVPLVLFLHGYVGTLDKVNWFDQTVPDSVKRLAERCGGILLAPFARSNTDFLGIGERDVLKTIELVKRDYRIDPDRVYLGGASMGGSGVWAMGAHYPHVFAALVPASGRTDYNLWQNIERGVLTPFKQFIVDRDYAVTLKPNFRNLPVFAFHGEDDWLVKPEQSKAMVQALRALAFEVHFTEFPRGDHWSCFDAFDDEKLITSLRVRKRNPRPNRVTYRTYHPRFNRAYWVTIDDFREFGKPAEIDVTVLAPTLVAVKSENVARFTLDVATDFFVLDQLQVRLPDGRLLKPSKTREGRATFTLSEVPEGGLRKRGELCGPVWEAYQRPFMMVYGSQGDAEAQQHSTNRVGLAALEWFEFAAGVPRVKKDADVTDEDIRRFNLILFGTPKTNLIIGRIAEKLPITIDEGKFVVGKRTYTGEKLGLAMIYPNPLNPKRTVVIYSGVPWGQGLPRNHKLDFLPDYIVFDDTTAPVSGTNNFKLAGFFDVNWKLDERLSWEGPEPAPPVVEPALPERWEDLFEEPEPEAEDAPDAP